MQYKIRTIDDVIDFETTATESAVIAHLMGIKDEHRRIYSGLFPEDLYSSEIDQWMLWREKYVNRISKDDIIKGLSNLPNFRVVHIKEFQMSQIG